MAKTNLTRAAEKMPEENYAFKPTPEIRSFGQLVGHCLLYTSDAADERSSVDLGGRRIIKNKNKKKKRKQKKKKKKEKINDVTKKNRETDK